MKTPTFVLTEYYIKLLAERDARIAELQVQLHKSDLALVYGASRIAELEAEQRLGQTFTPFRGEHG